MATDKETKETEAKAKASSVPYTPDALLALMGIQKQQQNDVWRPSVVNFQPSGVPTVQTQLAGTQFYDTTGTQFIAPGYEHLKDLSEKKDAQGKQIKSAWDNTYNTINSFDPGNNPTYQKAMMNIREAMAKHSDNLRNGIWSENSNMVTDFTNDLVEKKGLKQLMSIKAAEAAQKEYLKDLSGKYDATTQTKGIAPEDMPYYLANLGRSNDAIFDDAGNVSNTLTFTPTNVLEARNLPIELNKYVEDVKASSSYAESENGKLYTLSNSVKFQLGLEKFERVTEDQIRTAAESYILLNGGMDYLKRKAEINTFNELKETDLTTLKETLTKLAEAEALQPNNTGEYADLLEQPDDVIAMNAPSILGRKNFAKLYNSLINGAVATNAYSKEDITVVKDEWAMKEIENQWELDKIAYQASLKGTSDSDTDESGSYKYDLFTTNIQTTSIINPDNAYSLAKRYAEVEAEFNKVSADIYDAVKSKDPSRTQNNAGYEQSIVRYNQLKEELSNIKALGDNTTKGYATFIKGAMNVDMNDIYNDYVKSVKGKALPRDYVMQVLTAAVAAESDNNSGTTAMDILSKSKIGTSITTDSGVIKQFNTLSGGGAPSVTGGGAPAGKLPSSSHNNLVTFAQRAGKKIKDHYTKNKNYKGIAENDMATVPTIDTEITYINRPIGVTSSDVEGYKLDQVIQSITATTVSNLYNTEVFDPTGQTKISLGKLLETEFGIDNKYFDQIIDREGSEVLLTTSQTYGKNKGLVYGARLKLKPFNDDLPNDVKNAMLKIKKDTGSNPYFERRIYLGSNQTGSDQRMTAAIRDLYIAGRARKENVPPLVRQQMALAYANSTSLSDAIDRLKLERLKYRTAPINFKFNGHDFFISSTTMPGGENIYNLELQEGGVRKTLAVNKQGISGYYTADELKANPHTLIKKAMVNTLDLKAFLAMGDLDEQAAAISNKKGGGGQGGSLGRANANWKRSNAYVYKGTPVLVNGVSAVHSTYVPKEELVSLANTGIKFAPNSGIATVRADVKDNIVRTFTENNLIFNGGLRTKDRPLTDIGGAENSSHFLGQAVDVKDTPEARAFFKKLKANPNIAKSYGISWSDIHDKGTGTHLHLEFMPTSSRPNKKTGQIEIGSSNFANAFLKDISMGESGGNKNIGYHDLSKSSAYGEYGLLKEWIPRIMKKYDISESEAKSPVVIDKYMRTVYLEDAKKEIVPIFSKLAQQVRKFKKDFDIVDAYYAYHFRGIGFLKDVAAGRRSFYEKDANNINVFDYIKRKRKSI